MERRRVDLFVAGVDIGSTMTKVVIQNELVLVPMMGPTGTEYRKLAYKVMEEALDKANLALDDITYIVATGYGRMSVPFADRQISEISCHARGARSLFPSVRTVIDIGGQDSKAIKLGAQGKVANFVMNDKCAAGTGRFLEVLADSLGVKLEDLGEISLRSERLVKISSICTVFAEHEVIGHVAEGARIEDVLAGVHDALASRIYFMAERLKIEPDVVLTGGGAKNIGIRKAMEKKLDYPILVPPEPLLTGAIGAALLARELALKSIELRLPLKKDRRRFEEAKFFT